MPIDQEAEAGDELSPEQEAEYENYIARLDDDRIPALNRQQRAAEIRYMLERLGAWAAWGDNAQQRETRRAFYAGAHALFHLFAGIGEPEVSEDQGVDFLERVRVELDAFGVAVGEGRA